MAEGYQKKYKQHMNELIYLAWHTAYLQRVTKFPDLKSLLQEDKKNAQTDDEMMAMARMLNAAFGGDEVEA